MNKPSIAYFLQYLSRESDPIGPKASCLLYIIIQLIKMLKYIILNNANQQQQRLLKQKSKVSEAE
jgi:hypothetical protein